MAEKKEQKSIKNPHDKFFKETLGMRKNARSFLENYLPVQIRELIQIDSLEIEKDSFVTQELQDYYSDLLYKVKFGSYDGYIYLLFEHKSYSEKWICLQLLEYILQIWKRFAPVGDGVSGHDHNICPVYDRNPDLQIGGNCREKRLPKRR